NSVDGLIRSGIFDKEGKRAFPIILGGDVAGIVEKVGSKITKFKAGDPVFAYVSLDNSGGYAQYALVTEREAAPKPKTLTYVEAAAGPIVAMTALQALVGTAKLSAGQTVLLHGGSGGGGAVSDSICQERWGGWSEGDRDGFNCESGFPETTRGRCGDRLHQAKIRGYR